MDKEENLRTEYTTLASQFSAIATQRFTVLGFYLAAVGLIVAGASTKDKALLLLGLSIALWLLELRNRSLSHNLQARGSQIERQHWGYKGSSSYDPYFSRMTKVKPRKEDDPDAGDPPNWDYPLGWTGRRLTIPISYTVALDLIYLMVALYSLYIFIAGP